MPDTPRGLSADGAAHALQGVRPRTVLGRTVRQPGGGTCRRGTPARPAYRRGHRTAQVAVQASGTTLTTLYGGGAAELLARTGPIGRLRSADTFASYAGVAPIKVSSGEVVRHRRAVGNLWEWLSYVPPASTTAAMLSRT